MADQARVALLLDFDGTATEKNVGMGLIKRFAKDDSWLIIDNEYGNGRVGSREAYRLMGPLLTQGANEWSAYALSHRLDPSLGLLIARARGEGWSVELLSDGLDLYIGALLGREGLALPVRSGTLREAESGGEVGTPYMNPLCGRCATCKSERILELSNSGYYVIFVGDGFSDFCAAPKAHRVFAKDVLAQHMTEKGVAFEPFNTLGDVMEKLFT